MEENEPFYSLLFFKTQSRSRTQFNAIKHESENESRANLGPPHGLGSGVVVDHVVRVYPVVVPDLVLPQHLHHQQPQHASTDTAEHLDALLVAASSRGGNSYIYIKRNCSML